MSVQEPWFPDRWERLKCRAYWLLMRFVFPRERWLYRISADYRNWWGPR